MSLHRTTFNLTHEQWRFIEKNHLSLTKVVKTHLDNLILKQSEKDRISVESLTIPTQYNPQEILYEQT